MTEEVGADSRRLAAESDYLLIGISECTLSDRWESEYFKPHQVTSHKLTGRHLKSGFLFVCNWSPDVCTSLIVNNLLKH